MEFTYLVSDIKFWCSIPSTDTTTYPIEDLVLNANFALDRATNLILRSDARWKWDDTNRSDLSIGTQSIVSGQQDYSITVSHLKILKLRIKDSAGNWISISPTSRNELTDAQIVATGTPTQYEKIGNSVFLFPTPNYSSTDGLEIQFQRGASYFTISDTTKQPGFASDFHRLVSLYASLDYLTVNGMIQRATMVQNRITAMEQELLERYSQRSGDETPRVSFSKNDYGESALM